MCPLHGGTSIVYSLTASIKSDLYGNVVKRDSMHVKKRNYVDSKRA